MKPIGIVVLLVICLGVLCSGDKRCRPGIWCSRKNDDIKAKAGRRERIDGDRDSKFHYRGMKSDDAENRGDIEREFEGYFEDY